MLPISLLITFYSLLLCLCERIAPVRNSEIQDDDPDTYRNASELISSKGYPVEEHCVKTADGYLLSLQRMPHRKSGNSNDGENEPVLLIHGVLANASCWVLNFPDQSLSFVLYDAGYDVWLLNTRGCSYSRKHTKYTTKEYNFWDFSFDDIAHYDVPATIDYVLKCTRKASLYIIAYSQGTTAVFAMLSDMPYYNNKVKLFIALAPVVFVGHTTTTGRVLIPFANQIMLFTRIFTAGEFLLSKQFSKNFKNVFCRVDAQEFCENLLFAMAGPSGSQMNMTRFGVYVSHFTSSTSSKSLLHYAQMVKSNKFRKFDYGRHRNLEYYKQEEPPDYDLSKVTAPVALMWSTNDSIADPEDVELLRRQLNSVAFDYCVPHQYNHFDYFLALNAPELINKPVLNLLNKY